MTGRVTRKSIERRLTATVMATTGFALFVACVAFLSYDISSMRDAMVRNTTTLARVLGHDVSVSIQFLDYEAVSGTLAALAAADNVQTAAVYDVDGGLVWSLPTDFIVRAVTLDAYGDIVASGSLSYTVARTAKYDSGGALLWEADEPAPAGSTYITPLDVFADAAGTITVVNRKNMSPYYPFSHTVRYAPDGTFQSSTHGYGYPNDAVMTAWGSAITSPPSPAATCARTISATCRSISGVIPANSRARPSSLNLKRAVWLRSTSASCANSSAVLANSSLCWLLACAPWFTCIIAMLTCVTPWA